jgi:predicted permease
VLQIFLVTLPFFALIAAGYAAARGGALPLTAIPGLNVFVLYFALPCMLFRFGAGAPLAQLLDAGVALVWGLSALIVVGATVIVSRRLRRDRIGWNDAAFGALVAAFPNTGFMGVPLLVALLGAQAATPILISLALDMLLTSSLCIGLSRLDGADGHGAARAVRQALRGIAQNPLPWSMALGGVASATGLALPAPVERTIAMLAEAASPVALFTIGAVLARSTVLAREHRASAAVMQVMGGGASAPPSRPPSRRLPGDVLLVIAIKLIAHPLLVYGLARGFMALGVRLAQPALATIVLMAALPSASNVSMLAERFGADGDRIARIILWTTVAAFFSFPLIAALMA